MLCYLGAYYHKQILISIGISVILGTVALILIIIITVGFVRSYKSGDDLEDWSNPMTVFSATNRYSIAEYVFGRSLVGFRMAPKKAKILSYVLMLFVILNFFCGIFFLSSQIIIPAVICLCCFGVTVFVCMLFAVLRFILSLGKTIKKAQEEEAELDRKHEELLKKFEREEFEYHVATVISRTPLPPSGNQTEEYDGTTWYEYVLEIDGNRHTVKHPDFFETDKHVVAYSIEDIIFIDNPKSKELQKQEQEDETK